MKHLLVISVIAMSCVTAALAQRPTAIKPASVYRQDVVTFASPNQPGWVLLKSDNLGTVFEKRDQDAASNASVKTFKTKTFATDKERLIGFEALKKEELSGLHRDSIHFNYVRFKGSQCLHYDGVFKLEETSAPKFAYFNVAGYLCPHPKAKDSAVEMEFSTHSKTRGFTEELSSLSEEFFEKIAFQKGQ